MPRFRAAKPRTLRARIRARSGGLTLGAAMTLAGFLNPLEAFTAPLFNTAYIAPETGPQPQSFVVADLNGDGRADIAVANSSSSSISVLLGDGQGSFTFGGEFVAGYRPYDVAAGDLNGDG